MKIRTFDREILDAFFSGTSVPGSGGLTLAKLKAACAALKDSCADIERDELLLPVHPDKIPDMIAQGFTQRADGVWELPRRIRGFDREDFDGA